jgi:hypothetical protein
VCICVDGFFNELRSAEQCPKGVFVSSDCVSERSVVQSFVVRDLVDFILPSLPLDRRHHGDEEVGAVACKELVRLYTPPATSQYLIYASSAAHQSPTYTRVEVVLVKRQRIFPAVRERVEARPQSHG